MGEVKMLKEKKYNIGLDIGVASVRMECYR